MISLGLMLALLAIGCNAGTSPAATVRSYENDTVHLPSCHVEDLGLQTRVRWWRGGVLLADSDEPGATGSSQRVKMWGNRSLELVQVRPEDSGEYVCQASRPEPWGHVTQVHEIQVMYPASARPLPESGQLEITLGEEALMSCVSEGVPKPVLAWSFQGEELPILASGQRLRIQAMSRDLAGIYTCQASNGIGEPARATIELKIKHKPEVTAIRRWIHSAPGIRAQLKCQVVSWPEAEVEWYFEGEKVPYSRRFYRHKLEESTPGTSEHVHVLMILSVQAQDLGQYECKARNEIGSGEVGFELSGLAEPPLLKKESRTSSSNSYNFIWEVDSYSAIVEYQFWFRQLDTREDWRRLVIPSENEGGGPLHARSFNLTGLEASRQYEALVLARNHYGWSSPSKILRFATIPATMTEEAAYKIDNDGHEQIPPAVQVTSDSHRSSMDVNSSECLRNNFLVMLMTLLLPLLLPLLLQSVTPSGRSSSIRPLF
ncbi:PREDICTED: hemicentin-2-like [Ceratosolen solmsi marchali]|uniref:Hemicentin-2-like n=1 Tax=Ceratosolen solmsi marchali TaxID=326594 RepID=A0AAJ6YHG2_9HYME|nr:PREDICTED: hemicentin-2-like [Ceratosolen solmsi marchali]